MKNERSSVWQTTGLVDQQHGGLHQALYSKYTLFFFPLFVTSGEHVDQPDGCLVKADQQQHQQQMFFVQLQKQQNPPQKSDVPLVWGSSSVFSDEVLRNSHLKLSCCDLDLDLEPAVLQFRLSDTLSSYSRKRGCGQNYVSSKHWHALLGKSHQLLVRSHFFYLWRFHMYFFSYSPHIQHAKASRVDFRGRAEPIWNIDPALT